MMEEFKILEFIEYFACVEEIKKYPYLTCDENGDIYGHVRLGLIRNGTWLKWDDSCLLVRVKYTGGWINSSENNPRYHEWTPERSEIFDELAEVYSI